MNVLENSVTEGSAREGLNCALADLSIEFNCVTQVLCEIWTSFWLVRSFVHPFLCNLCNCAICAICFRYDSSVDPQITNEFAAAASRFGHAQIPIDTKRYGQQYSEFPLVSYNQNKT